MIKQYPNDAATREVYAARGEVLKLLAAYPDIFNAVIQAVRGADLTVHNAELLDPDGLVHPAIDIVRCVALPRVEAVLEIRHMTCITMQPKVWLNWHSVPAQALEGFIVGVNALRAADDRSYAYHGYYGATSGRGDALRQALIGDYVKFREI